MISTCILLHVDEFNFYYLEVYDPAQSIRMVLASRGDYGRLEFELSRKELPMDQVLEGDC